MEEMMKQILSKLEGVVNEVQSIKETMATKEDVAELKQLLQAMHSENITADDKLLEAVRTTNDRLDFQREKIIKVEEEIYLINQKQ